MVAPYVNLGKDRLSARISPWVNAGKNMIANTVMTVPAVTDTCTSCNVPLVSYCCAAEGTKRENINTDRAQETAFFDFVNIPQLNILANYAHVFCAIDIDSFRLAMTQRIVTPCPHRERDPEVTVWKRMAPPKHRPSELSKGDQDTKVRISGMGIGQWFHAPDKWPGGYRGNDDPKPYKPRTTRFEGHGRDGRFIRWIYGKETQVAVLKRLHDRKSFDPRYKYLSKQINYNYAMRPGTPHIPYPEDEGQLQRVQKPKWYRQMRLPFMNWACWSEGIRIRPQRNGKVDRVTGNMEYNDAFLMEGSDTAYPRSLNFRKDHPLAPTDKEVLWAKPADPRTPLCHPSVKPRNCHHRAF
ncbi:uncharacterized protein LAJ45_10725 [Morchella importuna]|uniref:uncharacterized protein n=1 Tax=Morchella importuna TaxID=1174673 RepID=UPI001E8E271A|nr:uncharacterized protein LAJ45_10725 [Morchella importuna]KAH8145288.1 hypothetical protein LAJ45_10725 [Morchella importuna]